MSMIRRTGRLLVACLTLAACSGKSADGGAAAGGASSVKGGTIPGSGDGFQVTMTGTVERPAAGPQAAGTDTTITTVRVLDGKARIDFSRGAANGLSTGGWMLVESDGARMSMVDPVAKKVMTMDGLLGKEGMGGMGGMMQMTVKDTSSQVEDLGAGETVLGFATRKYRVTTRYTIEMSMMGRALPMRTEQSSVVHLSNDVALLDAGFSAFDKAFTSSMNGITGNQAAEAIMALNASRPKGFPLIQEQESRVIRDGDTTTTRSAYRVTGFSRSAVGPADFTIPADYSRNDVGASLRDAKAKANEAMQQAAGAADRMRRAVESAETGRPVP
ncbi:MAG: hypothetical protein IT355_12865 [Gemmatimonadaceae bacterium]|nr:hypothetical protein [Gemmatimonadaceae bacterium]